MKKLLFIIQLMFMTATISMAQPPGAAYGLKSSKLVAFFNDAQYDSIWSLFSKAMQGHLPPEKNKEFFSGARRQFGKIQQAEYDHNNSKIATYKLTMENGLLALNMALDEDDNIAGFTITQFTPGNLAVLDRNKTKLILPFKGEWNVSWGGDTKEQNHHFDVPAQKNAFDILIRDDHGKSYKTDGQTNEDFYAFGQPLLAPCDAEVVQAVDGIKDNKPGDQNPIYVPGNSVMLKTSNNEYMLFAHFKQHSIKVKQGDKVKPGQLLGYCGNSGNSSEPHLHFHMENVEDMNIATGAKCYFDKIIVNGAVKNDYSPVKGDKVKNME